MNVHSLKFALPESDSKKKAMLKDKIGGELIGSWPWSCAIALDGGTTNTRARLVHQGRIVATARRQAGVRDAVVGEAPAQAGPTRGRTLADAVREALEEAAGIITHDAGGRPTAPSRPEIIVAAGMLCSEVGLVAVPHVPAPAGLDELSAGAAFRTIAEASDTPILFVPGVRTVAAAGNDGWMSADVMRGEECETLGALAMLARRGAIDPGGATVGQVFVWPGSHTKVVEVDGLGRIVRSHTSLAGELLQAVARHTLIAASLPPALPDAVDLEAADAGARAAVGQGLGRAAFLVRVSALANAMGSEERASFWVGAVVADDVQNLARHPILGTSRPVWVGGREPLRSLYARRLAISQEGPVRPLDDDLAEAASATGALEVAARWTALQPKEASSALREPAP